MHLVVGLGNPGPRYAFTRHNVGFMFLDKIANNWKRKHNYEEAKINIAEKNVLLIKPLTFMNLSGEIFNYINPSDFDDIIVVYDDVNIPLGKIRIRKKGSDGGHNGLKSIIAYIGEHFPRIRIGIGPKPENIDLVNFVLGEFNNNELMILHKVLEITTEALEEIVAGNISSAMNKFNSFEVKL
ncbi:aminoacyl-tRNA hydrolase [Thermosipho atlanticus]|uniref:aminoacyl-tRNA hydrolase n=1 Tax=Thermosipho atlanticus TaxID=238991 RepID=UPI0009331258|nr:aminoacyl-tRNA hydrolase [Thermosipho atlanticus]